MADPGDRQLAEAGLPEHQLADAVLAAVEPAAAGVAGVGDLHGVPWQAGVVQGGQHRLGAEVAEPPVGELAEGGHAHPGHVHRVHAGCPTGANAKPGRPSRTAAGTARTSPAGPGRR